MRRQLLVSLATSVALACASGAASPPLASAPVAKPAPKLPAAAPSEGSSAPAPLDATQPLVPAASAESTTSEPAPEPITVRVGYEKAAWVLPGIGEQAERALIYLHGRCGDPKAFLTWPRAARAHGTIVSLVGDQACADGHRFKWSGDVVGLDQRVARTLAQLDQQLGSSLADKPRVAIGYSQGSLMAEALGTRFPDRYPRVILIGGPRAPKPGSLKKSAAILLMAGDKDAQQHLQLARDEFVAAGRNAKFLALPGARHGEYGQQAEPVMNAALDWVLQSEPKPSELETAGR